MKRYILTTIAILLALNLAYAVEMGGGGGGGATSANIADNIGWQWVTNNYQAGDVFVDGAISANSFTGDGSGLTGIAATAIQNIDLAPDGMTFCSVGDPVSGSAMTVASTNAGIPVADMHDTITKGRKTIVRFNLDVDTVSINVQGFANTFSGVSSVNISVYTRALTANASATWTRTDLTAMDINSAELMTITQKVTLATLGITAGDGKAYQLIIARGGALATDTLTGVFEWAFACIEGY